MNIKMCHIMLLVNVLSTAFVGFLPLSKVNMWELMNPTMAYTQITFKASFANIMVYNKIVK